MIKLIGDSSLDYTPELKEELNVAGRAPLTIHMANGTSYEDTEDLDVSVMLEDMGKQAGSPTTACPSPQQFTELLEGNGDFCIVTLSQRLSGSYNSARVAAEQLRETDPNVNIHVFDSKSASAGQTLVALKIRALEKLGMSFSEIVQGVEEFIGKMRTFFVLEDISVFVKNGRINKLSGIVANLLSIFPVLCDDGNGDITLSAKVRGHSAALRRLVSCVSDELNERECGSVQAVIAYCKCFERADKLRTTLMENCKALSEVLLVPMSGLSSTYANLGGLVISFG